MEYTLLMDYFFWIGVGILALLIPTGYAGIIGAPYAPTRRRVVEKAFAMLGVGKGDTVVDLGVGDGKILKIAARRGAKAYGFELSPIMWLIATINCLGVAKVKYGNFYKRSIDDATVVFVFLMPKIMPRVWDYIANQNLSKARYIMSYAFPFKNETPVQVIRAERCAPIYVYEIKS